MINILHSIGWGIVAQVIALFLIVNIKERFDEKDTAGVVFVASLIGLAVFLLTL
jgi:hypothetical protein